MLWPMLIMWLFCAQGTQSPSAIEGLVLNASEESSQGIHDGMGFDMYGGTSISRHRCSARELMPHAAASTLDEGESHGEEEIAGATEGGSMKRPERFFHCGGAGVLILFAILILPFGTTARGQSAREKLKQLEAEPSPVAARQPSLPSPAVHTSTPSAQKNAPAKRGQATHPQSVEVAAISSPAGAPSPAAPSDSRPPIEAQDVAWWPFLVAILLVGSGIGILFANRKRLAFIGNVSIRIQVTVVAIVAVLPLLLVVFLNLLPEIRAQLTTEKIQACRQLVDVAYSSLADYAAMADRGQITSDQAQQLAIHHVSGLRYNENDYFWINDLKPTMLMHPFKPELNGKDISENKDPNGKRLFVAMVDVCKRSGEGPVEYMWPKPGVDRPVPKVSYVRLFKPWGWIIGTGVYVEDIDRQVGDVRLGILLGTVLALLVSIVLGFLLGRMIQEPLFEVTERMGNADLSTEFNSSWRNEIGKLQKAFDGFVTSLRGALSQVNEASTSVASASAQISSSTEEMAAGSHEQTAQATAVAGAVEELVSSISENARSAAMAAETATQARAAAEQGGRVVDETVTEMRQIAEVVRQSATTVQELGKSSDQIGEIVEVIEDIADQTNLLALNAAIEAARAGEQGRGFAVVADEVRKLAERTTKATKEIAGMIRKIQSDTSGAVASMERGTTKVDDGIRLADRAGASLREIVDISQKVTEMVQQIAKANEQQSSVSSEIARTTEAISRVTSETATGTQQIAQAAEDLNRLTEHLQNLVGQFHLEGGNGHEPSIRTHSPAPEDTTRVSARPAARLTDKVAMNRRKA